MESHEVDWRSDEADGKSSNGSERFRENSALHFLISAFLKNEPTKKIRICCAMNMLRRIRVGFVLQKMAQNRCKNAPEEAKTGCFLPRMKPNCDTGWPRIGLI